MSEVMPTKRFGSPLKDTCHFPDKGVLMFRETATPGCWPERRAACLRNRTGLALLTSPR